MAISYRGKKVDMVALAKKYENTVALGNAGMNGRGDLLKHGKVVKTREEVLADWYEKHKTVKETVGLNEDSKNATQPIVEEQTEDKPKTVETKIKETEIVKVKPKAVQEEPKE